MEGEWSETLLRDLLITTKDGDWGKDKPEEGYLAYHIIRGTDFPDVRIGDLSSVPLRYLPAHTVQRRTLEPGDILIETAGGTTDQPTGRTLLISEKVLALFDGPVTCASFARFLRIDRTQADPRFTFWFLQYLYEKGEMAQHQVQHTGVARFQYTRFAQTQYIPLPPLPTQRAIANILGSLDDKIELNRRMNETLESMARALFQSWFVDFDPVHAKAAGRPPAGMDAETAKLFPSSFETSALGEIPKGWRVGTLDHYALLNPESWSTATRPNNIQYVDLANTKWGRIESLTAFSSEEAPSRAQRVLRSGDTIVGTVRPGNGSFALISEEGLTGSTGFAVLRPKETTFREFVYLSATSSDNIDRLTRLADGGAYPAVRPDVVAASQVVIVDERCMKVFSNAINDMLDRIAQNHHQSRTLATLRDTLLPKLLSGELRVEGLSDVGALS